MPYKPDLEPGEKLELQTVFHVGENTQPFHFAVSNQALYWPARKAFAVSDATYFKRIRNGEISEVHLRRLPVYPLWLLAGLMVLAGLAMCVMMYTPLIKQEPGSHRVSGWPVAILAGGILLPFAARGRVGLEVRTQKKNFRWKPPLVVDRASKVMTREKLEEMISACERSGLRVVRN